jgi:hypothetical protein
MKVPSIIDNRRSFLCSRILSHSIGDLDDHTYVKKMTVFLILILPMIRICYFVLFCLFAET